MAAIGELLPLGEDLPAGSAELGPDGLGVGDERVEEGEIDPLVRWCVVNGDGCRLRDQRSCERRDRDGRSASSARRRRGSRCGSGRAVLREPRRCELPHRRRAWPGCRGGPARGRRCTRRCVRSDGRSHRSRCHPSRSRWLAASRRHRRGAGPSPLRRRGCRRQLIVVVTGGLRRGRGSRPFGADENPGPVEAFGEVKHRRPNRAVECIVRQGHGIVCHADLLGWPDLRAWRCSTARAARISRSSSASSRTSTAARTGPAEEAFGGNGQRWSSTTRTTTFGSSPGARARRSLWRSRGVPHHDVARTLERSRRRPRCGRRRRLRGAPPGEHKAGTRLGGAALDGCGTGRRRCVLASRRRVLQRPRRRSAGSGSLEHGRPAAGRGGPVPVRRGRVQATLGAYGRPGGVAGESARSRWGRGANVLRAAARRASRRR